MAIGDALQKVGTTFIAGFGDRVILGAMIKLFEGTTPDDCYVTIMENKPLFGNLSDMDWSHWTQMVKKYHVSQIPEEAIRQQFIKSRMDLMGVICNTPGGEQWFHEQIMAAKKKLGV